MKKYTIVVVMMVVALGLLNTTACKRNSSADPGKIGPTGHSITLSCSPDPDTINLPTPNHTIIRIKTTKYDPDTETFGPAVNRNIVLQPGYYGRFDGYNTNTNITVNTGTDGNVSRKYIIPQNAPVRVNTAEYITAILVNDLDPSDTSNNCVITIYIIPFRTNDYIKITGTIKDQFTNKGVKDVVVELSTGGVAKTNRSGFYTLYAYGAASSGWFGDITPTKEGASFLPASRTLGSADSLIYTDIPGQDFYAIVKQAIQVSRPQMNFTSGASGTESVYVFCTPDTNFNATFVASTSATWVRIGTGSADVNYSSITGTTPRYIYVEVDANATGEARDATIDFVATNPANAVSTTTISIAQEG